MEHVQLYPVIRIKYTPDSRDLCKKVKKGKKIKKSNILLVIFIVIVSLK